jgi:hypothetical protein
MTILTKYSSQFIKKVRKSWEGNYINLFNLINVYSKNDSEDSLIDNSIDDP